MIEIVYSFYVKVDKEKEFDKFVGDYKPKLESKLPKGTKFLGIWRHGFGDFNKKEFKFSVENVNELDKLSEVSPQIAQDFVPYMDMARGTKLYSLKKVI